MLSQSWIENFDGVNVQFLVAPNGQPVAVGADVIEALKGNRRNAADIIKSNVREKWWIDIPNPNGGRPVRCLFEPGVYQLAGNPMFQSEFAEQFQDWVYEDVLPKLRSQGYYIARNDDDTLAKAEAEIQELREKNALLTDEFAIKNLVQQFAINNLKYVPGTKAGHDTGMGKNYVMSGALWERWKKWSENKLHGLDVSLEVFWKVLDDYLQSQPGDKSKRIHIDKKNGFGDLENCKLIPMTKAKNFLHSGVYSIGE